MYDSNNEERLTKALAALYSDPCVSMSMRVSKARSRPLGGGSWWLGKDVMVVGDTYANLQNVGVNIC